jgi:6-pyruvoyl-tetrahydropterin synthase
MKVILQVPKLYILNFAWTLKCKKIRDESMMWNAMEMRHETRRVSSTWQYQEIRARKHHYSKSKKISQNMAKIVWNRPKDSSTMQGLNKAYNPHVWTSSQRVSNQFSQGGFKGV